MDCASASRRSQSARRGRASARTSGRGLRRAGATRTRRGCAGEARAPLWRDSPARRSASLRRMGDRAEDSASLSERGSVTGGACGHEGQRQLDCGSPSGRRRRRSGNEDGSASFCPRGRGAARRRCRRRSRTWRMDRTGQCDTLSRRTRSARPLRKPAYQLTGAICISSAGTTVRVRVSIWTFESSNALERGHVSL